MSDKKKFGLIMPKKAHASKIKKHSVFSEDESDDDKKRQKRPKIPQKKMDSKSKIKFEVVEDPSIYEYDNIYDEMKLKQAESITPKEKKNSRYIETLMKAADKRKKEYERRMDKKIQAEREKEGDKYKDKEAFVTSSYKKKMEELEEEEEKERRENILNDMMDVSKQKDLSGFYRHFLKQAVGEEKVPEFGNRQIKKEIVDNDDSSHNLAESFQDYKNVDQNSDAKIESSDNENLGNEKPNREDKKDKSYSHSQCFQSLPGSSQDYENMDQDSDGIEIDSAEDENLDNEKTDLEDKGRIPYTQPQSSHNFVRNSQNYENVNLDSDVEIDSGDENLGNEKLVSGDKGKTKKLSLQKYLQTHHRKSSKSSKSNSSSEDNESNDSIRQENDQNKEAKSDKYIDKRSRHDVHSSSTDNGENINKKIIDGDVNEKKSSNEKSPKKNIYIKRTVGNIFAEAQARYFQRMALQDART